MDLKYENEDDDWAEKDSIHVVSAAELADILEQQEVVFSF
jgi:tRNA 2-thiouridine synthesizing protein C